MKTFPLKSLTLDEAMEKQFELVDKICREFKGSEILTCGDLGVVPGINKPVFCKKAERAIASFFGAEDCVLVTGAGTGALRWAICSVFSPNQTILVHDAPIYPTTETSIWGMSLNIVRADFNDINAVKEAAIKYNIQGALVQHTRQKPEDSYDFEEVIKAIKSAGDIPVITDDNYAVMKVSKIGTECGGDISAFSSFKLLGPEGVGVIVGRKELIEKIDKWNYSGGGKIQGHQALEVLRGMVYAPVALAVQAQENEKLMDRLNSGSFPGVRNAFLANAQSKVLLVELEENIAPQVLKYAEEMGAAPNPVGAESKYEIAPMFYKVSGTFIKSDPSLASRMIRINPMRSGCETVLRILRESINKAKEVGN